MSDIKNILLVGVGGQGTILASNILSTGLLEAGYDVKMSEVHGMAQRGGSVSTQVRYGKQVFSPLIGEGQADILVSFEVMEALRWLDYLKPAGKVIINNYKIPSVPILIGKRDYPEGVLEIIKGMVETKVINANQLANSLGDSKVMNIVLLGALIQAMELTDIDWESIISKTVKDKFIEINIRALHVGMDA